MVTLIDTPCPPFTWKQAFLYQWKRYIWHAKQDMLGLVQPITGSSSRVKHRSFTDLLFNFRTTIRILRVDRANHRALKRYRPRPYSGRVIHLLRNQSVTKHSQDLCLKWENYVGNEIEWHTVPGDHHTMLREPNVRVLAEKLNEYLHKT